MNPVLEFAPRLPLAISPIFFPQGHRRLKQLHLHLLSDSTGETFDMVAKACLAQFDNVEALRHLWPMVRSEGHLDRVLDDVARAAPALVLYTVVNPTIRRELERKCRQRKINAVSVLDPVIDALAALCGEEIRRRAAPAASTCSTPPISPASMRSSSPSPG